MLIKDLVAKIYHSPPCESSRKYKARTFMKAHSFCAANLDKYIHEADFRLPM